MVYRPASTPKNETKEAIWGGESSNGEQVSTIKLNSDESDSDFDDAEVDLSHLAKRASEAPDTSSVEEALKILTTKYEMHIGNPEHLDDILVYARLQNAVNDAAQKLKAESTPEANKAYKEALQDMLNHRAYLIQQAHAKYIVPGDMKEDWQLSADSLLSVGELKLINQSIQPINGDRRMNPSKRPTKYVQKYNRKSLLTWEDHLANADKYDQENAANPISGISDNWTTNPLRQHLESKAEEKLRTGMAIAIHDSLKQALSRGFAHGAMATYFNPGSMIISDSSGKYAGDVIINGVGGKRVVTDSELASMLDTLGNAGDRMHMPGTDGFFVSIVSPIQLFITDWGKEWPDKPTTRDGVLGYANPYMGVTVLADKVRRSKRETDAGQRDDETLKGGPSSHFSTPITRDSMAIWEHVVAHEMGHMIAFRTALTDREMSQGSAPSLYGRESAHEHFAEYYAQYIRTGQVPEWFMDVLRARNMLKSQQNQ